MTGVRNYGEQLMYQDKLDEMAEQARPKKKHYSGCYYCGLLKGHKKDCPRYKQRTQGKISMEEM